MQIKQQLVTSANRIYSGLNKRKKITIHETANTNRGAHAQAHANLQSRGNDRQASWHWQVDDKEAIQSFLHTQRCWHAGTGRIGNGNTGSIAIELCVNSDGDWGKTKANAVELTQKIMRDENISVSQVVQHHHWSLKNCPRLMRRNGGKEWKAFLAALAPNLPPKPVKPAPPTKPKGQVENLDVDGEWGEQTTRALQRAMGTPVDGYLSGQYKSKWNQRIHAARFTRLRHPGSTVIRELQRRLQKRGLYSGKIDGLIGPQTITALQRYLGTPADGLISPRSYMVSAMQERLNEGTFKP